MLLYAGRTRCVCLQPAWLHYLEWQGVTYILRKTVAALVPIPRAQDSNDSRLDNIANEVAKSHQPKLGGYTDLGVGLDGVQILLWPNASTAAIAVVMAMKSMQPNCMHSTQVTHTQPCIQLQAHNIRLRHKNKTTISRAWELSLIDPIVSSQCWPNCNLPMFYR